MSARKLVNMSLSGLSGELQDIRNQRDLSLEKGMRPAQVATVQAVQNGEWPSMHF